MTLAHLVFLGFPNGLNVLLKVAAMSSGYIILFISFVSFGYLFLEQKEKARGSRVTQYFSNSIP